MKVSNSNLKLYNGNGSSSKVGIQQWPHRFRSLFQSHSVKTLGAILCLAWILRNHYIHSVSSPLIQQQSNLPPKKLTTAEERLQYQLEQRWFQSPPRDTPIASTIQGITSCPDVTQFVRSAAWPDPNDGVVFARRLTSWPPFTVAVHTRHYDPVRWNSIYRRGAYYETEVHERFVQILMEPAFVKRPPQQQQVVIDVGMNIGYYTLLSAALGVDRVVALEINPTNVVRVCESLRLNDWEAHVTIVRRGVSDQDGQTLSFHVPASNPGEAALNTKKDGMKKKKDAPVVGNPADPSVVTTITLDTLARENDWFSDDASISIPILKIDVEGLEPQVLLGATELLQSGLVRNILTEFRDLHSAVAQRALPLLLDAGYRLVGPKGVLRSLQESQRVLHQLATHPLSDTSRSTWQKVRSVVLSSYITDLWFALPDEEDH